MLGFFSGAVKFLSGVYANDRKIHRRETNARRKFLKM